MNINIGIYHNMSINFLLQSLKTLYQGDYTDDETFMIYTYLKNIDNNNLITYLNTNTLLDYENDLDLYVEVLALLISVFESKEEYEKCDDLLEKKEQSIKIMHLEKN